MIPSPRGILICLVSSTTILIYHHTGSSRPVLVEEVEKTSLITLPGMGLSNTPMVLSYYMRTKNPPQCA